MGTKWNCGYFHLFSHEQLVRSDLDGSLSGLSGSKNPFCIFCFIWKKNEEGKIWDMPLTGKGWNPLSLLQAHTRSYSMFDLIGLRAPSTLSDRLLLGRIVQDKGFDLFGSFINTVQPVGAMKSLWTMLFRTAVSLSLRVEFKTVGKLPKITWFITWFIAFLVPLLLQELFMGYIDKAGAFHSS